MNLVFGRGPFRGRIESRIEENWSFWQRKDEGTKAENLAKRGPVKEVESQESLLHKRARKGNFFFPSIVKGFLKRQPVKAGNILIKYRVEFLLLGKGRSDKLLKDAVKFYFYFILFHFTLSYFLFANADILLPVYQAPLKVFHKQNPI